MNLRLGTCCVLATMISGCGWFRSPAGPLAPPFQGSSGDGKQYSMLDMTRSNRLLVVFIRPDGKVGTGALTTAKKIQTLIGADKIGVLAVVATPVSGFESWASKKVPPIPAISDPDLRTTQIYKALTSPTFQVIEQGGILGPAIAGSDATSMAELETALGLTSGSLKAEANPATRDTLNLLQ